MDPLLSHTISRNNVHTFGVLRQACAKSKPDGVQHVGFLVTGGGRPEVEPAVRLLNIQSF
jgi:hypothetical protein